MSEKKVEKVTDKFVLMATSGKKMDGEVKNLPQIPPINYEFKALPESDCVVNKRPEFNEEEAYKNFLKEKEEMKAYYRPFFNKYSKSVNTPVTRTRLVDFLYRKEDKLDKKDFSRILNGEGEFEKVKLPHYVGPEYRWNAFYRTELNFDKIDESKFYLIEFEAVDYIGEIYLNGRLVGRHTGFFAPFTVDITDQVKEGVNVLVVAVKNDIITMGTDVNGHRSFGDKIYAATSLGYDEPYEGWHHCPAGAGIIGDVNLIVTGRQRVVDIFVRPDIDNSKATIYTTVFNYPLDCEKVKLSYRVEGRNFEELVIDGEEEISNKLAVNTNYFVHEVKIPNFKMWQPKLPYLYDVTVTVSTLDGTVLDEYQTHFGMRKFHMDENSTPKGKFYLNNERIVLRGANEMGHLPRCVMEGNDEQLFEDIMIAKVANMNYFRMTQRPVFKKIYDFFDMTGMMCQTDFPLFSYLKSSALGDAIKQVDEMERLVRNHPCCVVDTFCNETLDKTCWGHEQYNLGRFELEHFFNAGREIIHILNPDRVIKYNDGDYSPLEETYGISDFHTYTYWYISHGIPGGMLNKGYLPPIRKGWMSGCGEYGCDGLDRFELLKKYCPKEWLPEKDTDPWSPKPIAKSQCFLNHGFFFPEQDCARDWIRESRKHQAWATKELTTQLRRRADIVESTALHLFIDAWPCGWTKTVVDVDRIPKPAFYTFKEALIPVRISLMRHKYVVYSGDTVKAELFILNDTPNKVTVETRLNLLLDGKLVKSYKVTADGEGAIQTYVGGIEFKVPENFVGKIEILAEDNNGTYDSVEFYSKPHIKKASKTPVFLGTGNEPIKLICDGPEDKNTIIATRDYFVDHQQELEDFAFNGGKLIVTVDKPLNVLGEDIGFRVHVSAEEVEANVWVARSEESVYTKEFDEMDFKNFYNQEMDYQELTNWVKFFWTDSKEILYTFEDTTDPKYALHKKHKMIVAEKAHGKGKIILNSLSCYKGCVSVNPVLDKFLVNLIEL